MRKIGLFLLLLPFLLSAEAQGDPSDGAGGFADKDDFVYLLSRQMDMECDVAAVAWANMDDEQRKDFMSRVEDVLLLAEAGRMKGLSFNPEVSRELKWDEVNVLAKAYVKRLSMNWTLDGPAIEDFYEKKLKNYSLPERIFAKIERDGKELLSWNGPEFSGTASWYETGKLPGDLKRFLVRDFVLGKLPEFKSEDGSSWKIEILQAQGNCPLPLDTVKDQVKSDLESELLAQDVARLREQLKTKK